MSFICCFSFYWKPHIVIFPHSFFLLAVLFSSFCPKDLAFYVWYIVCYFCINTIILLHAGKLDCCCFTFIPYELSFISCFMILYGVCFFVSFYHSSASDTLISTVANFIHVLVCLFLLFVSFHILAQQKHYTLSSPELVQTLFIWLAKYNYAWQKYGTI